MRNREELVNIAGSAKLSLSAEEIETIYNDASCIMGLAQKIDDVDLSLYDCSDEVDISELREDVVIPSLPVDTILYDAAEKHDNFFTV